MFKKKLSVQERSINALSTFTDVVIELKEVNMIALNEIEEKENQINELTYDKVVLEDTVNKNNKLVSKIQEFLGN